MPKPKRNRSPHLIEGLHAIAKRLNRSKSTIERWIADGVIPAAKLPDGTWVITPSLIDRFIVADSEARLEKHRREQSSGIANGRDSQ